MGLRIITKCDKRTTIPYGSEAALRFCHMRHGEPLLLAIEHGIVEVSVNTLLNEPIGLITPERDVTLIYAHLVQRKPVFCKVLNHCHCTHRDLLVWSEDEREADDEIERGFYLERSKAKELT